MLKSIYPKLKYLTVVFVLVTGCLLFMYAVPAKNQVMAKPLAANLAPVSDSASLKSGYDRFLSLYDQLNLDSLQLSHEAFMYGLRGYQQLVDQGAVKNQHIISIVDFSLPSTKKRLFIIDLESGKLLFNTLVSHGRNSGTDMATRFSNDLNSFKSSLGFFVTGNTYKGEHGYSLRLDGKEKGINDRAYSRAIVMHAADYVNDKVIQVKGYLGRSLGCPAVPPSEHKAIINTIKDGTCMFVYSPDSNYISSSPVLAQPFMG